MNHCLVFGARGHLAKTRIIPALKKLDCPHTPISRQHVANLEHLRDVPNVVAYMSIPTHNFCENVEPYLGLVDATYILEKPHGHSKYDFERIKTFIDENNLKVVYNDHYLGKDILQHIRTPKKLESIKIKLHETGDMNERINYFDTVGIVGDMYQSHCVLLFATIIAKHTFINREEILKELGSIEPQIIQIARNMEYKGTAPTECKIAMTYKGIELEADLAKMVPGDKHILINENDKWELDFGGCAYENVLREIKSGNKDFFLKEKEIDYLWDHASIISC
jgi:glucose-6-phosphate 1-dehydrogenase